jgi:DNA-binding NarL/FixJ family response regulator
VHVVDGRRLLAQMLGEALQWNAISVRISDICDDVDTVLEEVVRFRAQAALVEGRLPLCVPILRRLSHRGMPVAILDDAMTDAALGACLEAGAVTVISTNEALHRVIGMVRELATGGGAIPAGRRDELIRRSRRESAKERVRMDLLHQLTPRELSVLFSLAEGMPPQRIASESFVSIHTVRTQIQSILTKLDVHSQLQAVALARHTGALRSLPA